MPLPHKYAKINLNTNNHAAVLTKQKSEVLRVKLEIKSLYKKKQHLNTLTYQKHVEMANAWGNNWPNIEKRLIQKLQDEMFKVHLRQNNRITTLKKNTKFLTNPQQTHTYPFFHRIKNLTNTEFTLEENTLLSKGLQHNPNYKRKNWAENLALEAETAISHLHISEQNYMRHLVANNIKHLIELDKKNRNNKQTKTEWNILKNIKQKLENNNLILTQADNGKEIVILQKQIYEQYIQDFLNQTHFTPITHDPTKTFHRKVQTVVNKCNKIIKKQKFKYHNNY
jgi:hypothetical protein